jgi:hypothetical protein
MVCVVDEVSLSKVKVRSTVQTVQMRSVRYVALKHWDACEGASSIQVAMPSVDEIKLLGEAANQSVTWLLSSSSSFSVNRQPACQMVNQPLSQSNNSLSVSRLTGQSTSQHPVCHLFIAPIKQYVLQTD